MSALTYLESSHLGGEFCVSLSASFDVFVIKEPPGPANPGSFLNREMGLGCVVELFSTGGDSFCGCFSE